MVNFNDPFFLFWLIFCSKEIRKVRNCANFTAEKQLFSLFVELYSKLGGLGQGIFIRTKESVGKVVREEGPISTIHHYVLASWCKLQYTNLMLLSVESRL